MPSPQDWQVLITGHHAGYIDWDTYLANTARLAAMPGELAQHPFGEVVPVPAGVACRDQRADQAGQRRRAHERAPCPESRTSSTSRAQRRRCSVSSLR